MTTAIRARWALLALCACRPVVTETASTPPPGTADAAARCPEPPAAPASDEGGPIRVAITVDDLPGDPEAVGRMLDVFAQHQVPPVHGFINGGGIRDDAAREAILRRWLAEGHRLGNHTFSHPHSRELGAERFIADVQKNEPVLQALHGPDADPSAWKTFRYPFLEQGGDAANTAAIREHLLGAGYRIAEVTIDFGDWAWNGPYARCLARGDEPSIAALRGSFLGAAWVFLGWADAAGRQAYGRPIPQVLLLHSGGFDGVMLDELLSLYEKQGVQWIGLEEALDDEAYRQHQPPPSTHGDTMIEQFVQTTGAPHPPWFQQPLVLLDAICR